MKKLIFIAGFIFVFSQIYFSQCEISSLADTVYVCQGDSIYLSASGGCITYLMDNNFNNGTSGTGWASGCFGQYNNPCIASHDSSIYCWFGPSNNLPRDAMTTIYAVSTNCSICFDMVYAVEGELSPCEGIDQPDEGVYLQYSVNGGATWIDIEYWPPDDPNCSGSGGYDSCMTQWTHYSVDVPPGATGSTTMFNWHQENVSSNYESHWGLDNIKIFCDSANVQWVWNDGTADFAYIQNPVILSPTNPGIYNYYVTVSDGINNATDSVVVQVSFCNAIDENTSNSFVSIYPNPVNSILHIESQTEIHLIELLDICGKKVFSVNTVGKLVKTDISDLPQGMYFIRIKGDGFLETYKVIKQ
ncbi:MAG: T9SS type A sorting domain-containing protein [Bacteroidota bacterium]